MLNYTGRTGFLVQIMFTLMMLGTNSFLQFWLSEMLSKVVTVNWDVDGEDCYAGSTRVGCGFTGRWVDDCSEMLRERAKRSTTLKLPGVHIFIIHYFSNWSSSQCDIAVLTGSVGRRGSSSGRWRTGVATDTGTLLATPSAPPPHQPTQTHYRPSTAATSPLPTAHCPSLIATTVPGYF